MLYTEKLEAELKSVLETVELKERKTKYNMIVSKEVKDRDGETVMLDGMDMKNYKKNPVVLIDHSYKVEDIVGKTTKLKRDGNELIAEFVFIDTPKGELAEKLYEAGLLKASSIGFIGKERDPQDYTKITKSELLEWSLVAVPANAEALSIDGKLYEKGVKEGLIKEVKEEEKSELDEIKEELAEIKTILKSLADDKAEKQDSIAKEEAELKAKKELLQSINKGISSSLEKIKLLK